MGDGIQTRHRDTLSCSYLPKWTRATIFLKTLEKALATWNGITEHEGYVYYRNKDYDAQSLIDIDHADNKPHQLFPDVLDYLAKGDLQKMIGIEYEVSWVYEKNDSEIA